MKFLCPLFIPGLLLPAIALAHLGQPIRLASEWLELLHTRLSGRIAVSTLRESEAAWLQILSRAETATATREPGSFLRLWVGHSGFLGRMRAFHFPLERTEQEAARLLFEALDQPLPARNLFEGLESQGVLNRSELQRLALEEALALAQPESFFARDAAAKLPHFQKVEASRRAPFERTKALLRPEAIQDDALAFILHTFRSREWDSSLLWSTILAIRDTGRLNRRQTELLVQIARGSYFPEVSHSQVANEALIRLGAALESGLPLRFPSTFERPTLEWLKHEPIRSITRRPQTSMNGSYLVEFTNGRRAIFKPYALERSYSSREARLWDILFAREVGAFELVETWLQNAKSRRDGFSRVFVPPTVETLLVHEGRSYGVGSLQEFQEGFVSADQIRRGQPELWSRLMDNPSFRQSLNRMRAIDWLLGNYDRLPNSVHTEGNFGNFMIRLLGDAPETAEIAMIDNGIGQGRYNAFWMRDLPPPSLIPEDLQQVVRELDLDAFARLNEDRLSKIAIDDFRERVTLMRGRLH